MKTRHTDLSKHFSSVRGASSIGEIWPQGGYEEFMPSGDRQESIAGYWQAASRYLQEATERVERRKSGVV